MPATDHGVQWTLPMPTPIVVTPDEMTDEDPFWIWTPERLDQMLGDM